MNKSRKIIAFLTALVLFAGIASILLPEEISPISSAMAADSPDKGPITPITPITHKAGEKITNGKSNYEVLPDGTLAYLGPVNKNVKTITIHSTATIDGVTYKITKIGAKAFKGCKKLKTVKIKGKYLKTIDKNAFKGLKKSQLKKIKVKISKKNPKRKSLKKQAAKAGVKKGKIKFYS